MITRAFISIDIEKNKMWYQMLIPNGAHYDDAMAALDDIKAYLAAEKEKSLEQQSAAAEKPAASE